MTLFFIPLASLVLGAVPRALEEVASGANAAFRELGGVLGIAVLGVIFSAHGSYASGRDYVNGMTAAVYVAAAIVAVGALAAMVVPNRRARSAETDRVAPERTADLAEADGVLVAGLMQQPLRPITPATTLPSARAPRLPRTLRA